MKKILYSILFILLLTVNAFPQRSFEDVVVRDDLTVSGTATIGDGTDTNQNVFEFDFGANHQIQLGYKTDLFSPALEGLLVDGMIWGGNGIGHLEYIMEEGYSHYFHTFSTRDKNANVYSILLHNYDDTLVNASFWRFLSEANGGSGDDHDLVISNFAGPGVGGWNREIIRVTQAGNVGIGSTASPVSTLDVNGGVALNITTPDLAGNSYTVTSTDYTILIDDDDADVTGTVVVVLPAIATNLGRILNIKKIGSSETVQLDGNASEEIDESGTVNITTQYDNLKIQCGSAGWWIL